MEEEIRRHDDMLPGENKTGTTVTQSAPSVTESSRTGLCGYVMAPGATPFCNRSALAGSSYCAWDRALCAVAPEFFDESDDERLAGLDLPAPAIARDE
ncbi:MAG: hypothetical protein ACRED7_08625 [Stellaceae bacterium]